MSMTHKNGGEMMGNIDLECMTDEELNAYFSPEYIRERSYKAKHRSLDDIRRMYQDRLDHNRFCEQEWTFDQYVQLCYRTNDDGTFYVIDEASDIEEEMWRAHIQHTIGFDAYLGECLADPAARHPVYNTNKSIGLLYYLLCASGKLDPEKCPYTTYRDVMFQQREDGCGYDWRPHMFENAERLQAMINAETA